jgi:hypothetical protein
MVVVKGTKTRRHTIGLIPKRRIFSCMISKGTVIQKSWHHSYIKAIAPHFFVLSKRATQGQRAHRIPEVCGARSISVPEEWPYSIVKEFCDRTLADW